MSPKTAFVFPGGGSQVAQPIKPFHETWNGIDRAIDRLEDPDIRQLLLDAGAEELDELLNMHRALLATGYTVAEAVQHRFDVRPDVVAGHSTGHVTALAVAGAIPPDAALEFISGRSRSMKASAEDRGSGKMVAVLLAESGTVETVVSDIDDLSIAAYNTPRQTVISGHPDAVDTACDRLETDHGPVRTVELDVELGAHSPMVAGAREWARGATAELSLSDPAVPVVSDYTGEPYETAAEARRQLPEQIVSPVQWQSIVESFEELGVTRVVEFPPAGVLTEFVSNTSPEMSTVQLANPATARSVFDDG